MVGLLRIHDSERNRQKTATTKKKNKKRKALLQEPPAKNPKTNQRLKFIQFVSNMMMKCCDKTEVKRSRNK